MIRVLVESSLLLGVVDRRLIGKLHARQVVIARRGCHQALRLAIAGKGVEGLMKSEWTGSEHRGTSAPRKHRTSKRLGLS